MIQKHPDHARDWPLEALAALRESPRLRTCASLSDSAEGGQHSGLLLVHPPTSNSRLLTSQPQLPGMIAQTTPILEEHQTYGTHSSWDMAHLVPQPRPVNEQGFTHQGIVIAPEGQPMTYPGTMMNDFAHQGSVFAPPHLGGSGNAEQGFSQAAVLADLLRRSAELELGSFVQPQASQYVDQLETVTHLPPWHHDGPGLGPLDRLPGRGPYDSMSMPGLAVDPGRGLVDVHPANFPYFAITGVPWPDRATGILTSRPRRYPWLGSGGNRDYEPR